MKTLTTTKRSNTLSCETGCETNYPQRHARDACNLERISEYVDYKQRIHSEASETRFKYYEERKSTKSGTRSAAFLSRKTALYADARKNADNAVKEGVAYMYVPASSETLANLRYTENNTNQR
jgi:hypothetical protein